MPVIAWWTALVCWAVSFLPPRPLLPWELDVETRRALRRTWLGRRCLGGPRGGEFAREDYLE